MVPVLSMFLTCSHLFPGALAPSEYHYVQQAVKKGNEDIADIKSADNTADLFTKRLPHGPLSFLRGHFMQKINQRDLPNEVKVLSPIDDSGDN